MGLFSVTTEQEVLAQLMRIADALDRAFPEQEPPPEPDWDTTPSISNASDEETYEEEVEQQRLDRYW